VAPPEISLHTLFAGVLPFVLLQVIGLLLVLMLPQIALWPLG
jgi:TRAP-type mannitol/chloroaromatic compound transport system permease large subunit